MTYTDSEIWQLIEVAQSAHYPLLVIAPHNREINRLAKIIKFLEPSTQLLTFEDWETLPYDRLSPSHQQTTQRLQALNQLDTYKKGLIFTTPTGILQRLPPKSYIQGYTFNFSIGQNLDLSSFSQRLSDAGYQRVEVVTLPGEFAMRGEIIDLFPLNKDLPLRLHVAIDTLENMYSIEPGSQQLHEPIDSIDITPTREFLLSERSIQQFQTQGKEQWGERFLTSAIKRQVTTHSCPPGIEYYLPLFFEQTYTLLDYLPRHTHWVHTNNLETELAEHWQYINTRYQALASDLEWPILPPEALYQPPAEVTAQLKNYKAITTDALDAEPLPSFRTEKNEVSLQAFKQFLDNLPPQTKVIFCTHRLSQQEALVEHLKKINIHLNTQEQNAADSQSMYTLGNAPMQQGFISTQKNLCVIPSALLYPQQVSSLAKKPVQDTSLNLDQALHSLERLKINDTVIHADHGIGRYLGLQTMTINGHSSEFILLAYAQETKLYVPIQEVGNITRYTTQGSPELDSLNSTRWRKTKQKTLTQLKDTAAELLELYATRTQAKGEPLASPTSDYESFANEFPYEETQDQLHAIQEILQDLTKPYPMDRLVCGDVGFGKTEVAIRAAFLAVQSNKQVAILAPTTLLAEQHYRNFKERFSKWPITIDWLSRFRTPQQGRQVRQALASGDIDIIIGTHALLSKLVTFKNLGLLIIDEEHHFGVQQKEKLKALKTNIHVLTLTATPIPRTLQTALSGLRSLSLITTPPANRLSIKNILIDRSSTRVREAITRELLRGGQVYFVHNRVDSLPRVAREIQGWVPEANIEIAHGQMPEKALANCMERFNQQSFNVLLCTSIIETGLDIASVNTLIVDRAEHFGLAQLHQLRGRVGRSHHQAYAYFIVTDESHLSQDAKKRLGALEKLTELGSGFHLASHDLDIRGAGELLGDKQSGVLEGVGFSFYVKMLEQTIESMKNRTYSASSPLTETLIDLKIPAFIPDHYIADVATRLEYYRKITQASDIIREQLHMELIDRYDLLPLEVRNLFAIAELKQRASALGITKIDSHLHGGWLTFSESPNILPARIIDCIQNDPNQFRLDQSIKGAHPRLGFAWGSNLSSERKISYIQQLLGRLSE